MHIQHILLLVATATCTLLSGCNNDSTTAEMPAKQPQGQLEANSKASEHIANNKSASKKNDSYTTAAATHAPSQAMAQQVAPTGPLPAKKWLEAGQIYNREAPIPPQCYTKTDQVNNPCYVCHQSYHDQPLRPNKLNDGFQQGSYAFSDLGVTNSWRNLFQDRTHAISRISDKAILSYINEDNYTPFIEQLKQSDWQGIIPEVQNLHLGAAAFDEHGLAKDGSGWVAFNYKPMPSTFWPTNGSTDDVMIRLPEAFMQVNGKYSRDVYYANLALVEMAIADTQQTTSISLNEQLIGADLNGDGVLTAQVNEVVRSKHYVGDAKEVPLHKMLYPEGTAFLHTVRYVNVNDEGDISVSPRMKEVRYMVKKKFLTLGELKGRYYLERKEKHFENLPYANDFGHDGVSNKHGWTLLGFIENEQGQLRQQNHEEQFFCTGCHKSVGAIIDETFSFPRKVAGVNGWGYIDLKSMQDAPNVGEEQGEYLTYLQRVRGGDEFRQNQEMLTRWFKKDGSVDIEKVKSLPDIYSLITPSKRRALDLNKAYKTIVEEQSFIYGRDATLGTASNVLLEIDEEIPPLHPEHQHQWDIRLNWHKTSNVTLANKVKR